MFSETLSARLFMAENFPKSEFEQADTQGDLIEWADFEVEKVAGSLSALVSALCANHSGRGASVLDFDMVGLLSILEGRLKVAGAALKEAQRLDRAERIEL